MLTALAVAGPVIFSKGERTGSEQGSLHNSAPVVKVVGGG
jgi:hypothetical protein